MEKNNYTYSPKLNQDSNNNLPTKKMFLSKRFNMKSLKIAASCLLSSFVAIPILGTFDNRAYAEFPAVMRLNELESKDILILRKERSLSTYFEQVELFIEDSPNKSIVERQINGVGKLDYKRLHDDNYYLLPTTVVLLNLCRNDGWCSLKQIVKGDRTWNKGFENYERQNNTQLAKPNLRLWVPASHFCDMTGAEPLLDCSERTRKRVYQDNQRLKLYDISGRKKKSS